MTALRKILIEEETVVAAPVARAPAVKLYVVANNAPAEAACGRAAMRSRTSSCSSPRPSSAWSTSLPSRSSALVVLAVLAGRFAAKYEAVRTTARVLKNVGMVVAAPVLGLAYVVFFPFIGLAALAWMGGRAVIAAGAR